MTNVLVRDVLVTHNLFVRFINNKPLLYDTAGGVAIVATVIAMISVISVKGKLKVLQEQVSSMTFQLQRDIKALEICLNCKR